MPYAILQRSLAAPLVEGLARAFRVVPQLRPVDAGAMARDAFGILVQGLDRDDAERLLEALRAEGIEAEAVDQERLPVLPAPRPLRRAECHPLAFVAYDPLGRPTEFDWSHVLLVAAGLVRRTEFRHVVRERVARYDYEGGPITVSEHSEREEEKLRPILEVFLDTAPGRYRIEGERFNYSYLGDRLHDDRMANFATIVQDCVLYTTRAVLNRGAATLQPGDRTLLAYPSRHAFEEEIVWLLWRQFASRVEAL